MSYNKKDTMRKHWLLIFGIVCCVFGRQVVAQSLLVYPGDVTNNGVVNNLDFLHLGLAYNFAGPARDSAAQGFAPEPAYPWSYQFPNGLNMAYADCNGDGIVNYFYDAFPLYTNYGLQRTNNVIPDIPIDGMAGIDPPLQFDSTAVPDQVQGGQMVQLPIELGSMENPAEDFYGLSFSMFVDPTVVDANSVMFNLSETSWANPDNDRIWMYKKVAANQLDVSWVRTDRNQKRGFGRIGYVDFVIIVDVVPLQQASPVSFENIRTMDKFGNYAAVAGDTIWLNVPSDSVISSAPSPVQEPQVTLMPNPASEQLFVRSSEKITGLQVADLLGRVVWQTSGLNENTLSVQLPKIFNGIYTLRIETERGVAFKKLQIHQE